MFRVYVCVYIYMYVCVCIYIYVCMYLILLLAVLGLCCWHGLFLVAVSGL